MTFKLSALLLALLAGQARSQPAEVRACGGSNEWPPFVYYLAGDSQHKRVAGYSPDVLAAALEGTRFIPVPGLLPYARCLASARSGIAVQIVMSAFRTPQREQEFHFSQPYLELTPRIYFVAERWPRDISLQSPQQLAKLQLCGIRGASYDHLGPLASSIAFVTSNYKSLVEMLHAGRCQAFVESQEVINGLRMRGVLDTSVSRLDSAPVPDVERPQVHFAVSRQYPHSAELLRAIDLGIAKLAQEGRLAALLSQHQLRQ